MEFCDFFFSVYLQLKMRDLKRIYYRSMNKYSSCMHEAHMEMRSWPTFPDTTERISVKMYVIFVCHLH